MNRFIPARASGAALIFAAATAILAACATGGSSLPPGMGGTAKAPDRIERCVPTVGHPCPTPSPTPTPYNGPVGSSNNLKAVSSNPSLLTSGTSHVIYVNYTSAMGNQTQFLKDLEGSAFFTYILDQYVPNHGTYAVDATPHYVTVAPTNGYYTQLVPLTGSTCPPPSILYEGNGSLQCESEIPITYYDEQQVSNATASLIDGGTTSDIWHIIVPGDSLISLCRQSGSGLACWGPGSGMANECGEHDPVPIPGGIGHYTIQQSMPVCNTDNEADGISSTLSHELFETLTDPDLGSGWRVGGSSAGLEIGDLCEDVDHWIALPLYNPFTNTGTFYDIQPEWSNKDAHCYIEGDQSATLGLLMRKR